MNGYKSNYHLEKTCREFRDLRDLLRTSAQEFKNKTAFVTKVGKKDDVTYINTSYRKLYGDLERMGTALLNRVPKGSRFAVIGANSYPWILSYCAAACGAGVTVPLDPGLQQDELESCLIRSGASAIFYDKKQAPVVRAIREAGNTQLALFVSMGFVDEDMPDSVSFDQMLTEGAKAIEAGDFRYIEATIDPDAMSFLLFTSGTTARSKAVMLSHRNLMNCHYGMSCEEYFLPDDVNMLILPLHHIYGFGGLLMFLSHGLKNVFCDGLRYIQKNLAEYEVTLFTSVPLLVESMYKKIDKAIDKNGLRGKVNLALKVCAAADKVGVNLRPKMFKAIHEQLGGHLRFIINGAAALDPKVAKGFNEFGILTVQGYGLTETSPTIASETYRWIRTGSCGKFMPNIQARIDDPDENGIGELVVKADSVMLGYYDDPEATAAVMEDGWFHTGDLARVDKDGYVFICGRLKNVIVMKNGKNVFPEEIENLINLLPYVNESMVFTQEKLSDLVLWAKIVPDPEWLKENGMTMEELEPILEKDMEKINAGMPQYKMVKHWYLSDVPTIKTTTLKTKRRLEQKVIEEELKARGLK